MSTRRAFLTGAAAVCAAPLLPPPAAEVLFVDSDVTWPAGGFLVPPEYVKEILAMLGVPPEYAGPLWASLNSEKI